MTLLEKALAARKPAGRPALVSEEMMELAIAWARGDVGLGQCTAATKISDTGLYCRLACCLKAAVQRGRLVEIPQCNSLDEALEFVAHAPPDIDSGGS